MNLGGTTIVLRQRSPLDILDLSILFCRVTGGKRYLTLAAIFILPSYIVLLGLHYGADLTWRVLWPVALAAHLLLEFPFLALAGRLLFEPGISVRSALASSARRLPAYVAVQALVLAVCAASVITVVGPWIVLVFYCFVPEILVLEGTRGWSTLTRARKFLRGRSGAGAATVLLRLLLMLVLVVLAEELGQAGFTVFLDIDLTMDHLWQNGGSPFALAGLLLSSPLTATFRFLSYLNERTVQDGWDVQVALLALVDERPAEAA